MKLTILTILVSCPVVFLRSIPPQSFRNEVVQRHNELRAKHQVGPVTENPELSLYAQEWADTLWLASYDTLEDRPYSKYGENLAFNEDLAATGGQYVDQLYKVEESNYRQYGFYDTEPTWVDLKNKRIGHFTQIVWKDTKEIGIGKADEFVVINYNPRGNVFGQYKANVFEPKEMLQFSNNTCSTKS